ncbi:nitrile hydratase subunit alpha [Ruegeria sp. 2205SS24-7]|uniref:nitrile hydratase subunit alpha n=1 Tax=Ruegeria discodermiae TaxID=3064389 RepID=UPI002741446F|nr:nitrile hydratase subunit alpha [Ruegeria sp. 2205SS24-7]MDP5215730.1 nitrile hydratase subunit alpha [Ruegeria sp. 2205SS24-7]
MLLKTKEAHTARFLDKVWSDDAYRARLQDDARSALAEIGGDVPEGIEVRCVMDTDRVRYLHIPAAPEAGEISDRDLTEAQGGTTLACLSGFVVSVVSGVTFSATIDG